MQQVQANAANPANLKKIVLELKAAATSKGLLERTRDKGLHSKVARDQRQRSEKLRIFQHHPARAHPTCLPLSWPQKPEEHDGTSSSKSPAADSSLGGINMHQPPTTHSKTNAINPVAFSSSAPITKSPNHEIECLAFLICFESQV